MIRKIKYFNILKVHSFRLLVRLIFKKKISILIFTSFFYRSEYVTMIVIIIHILKFQQNASVGVIPARNTTLFKLHLLANPAHFWLKIWELLLKMTFSLLCSRNLIPLREISRVNPIKIVPSVSIRSNLFEENSCKIFNDVLLVSNNKKRIYR